MSKNKSIFIVDDDEEIRKIYRRFLNLGGYDVMASAVDGKEAVDMFITFDDKPDIILMDYHMPNKNGLQAAKEILELNHETKIFILSGDLTVKEKVVSNNGLKFILKPTKVSQLCKIIEEQFKL